jgi:hypothetical protein
VKNALIQPSGGFEKRKPNMTGSPSSLQEIDVLQQNGTNLMSPANGTSYSMPFVEAQERRVKELSYSVPTTPRKNGYPPSRPTSCNKQPGYPVLDSKKCQSKIYTQNRQDLPNNQQDLNGLDIGYEDQYANSLDLGQGGRFAPLDPHLPNVQRLYELWKLFREE